MSIVTKESNPELYNALFPEDEIKEIINDLQRVADRKCYPEDILCGSIAQEWADYITNLQEELKEYKMIFDTFSKRPYAHRYLEEKKKELGNKNIIGLDSEMIYKDYYDLKQENESLKELNVCVGCNNNPDYKQRIDKAINMLELTEPRKKICKDFVNVNRKRYDKILNILKGEEKYE